MSAVAAPSTATAPIITPSAFRLVLAIFAVIVGVVQPPFTGR